MYEVIAYITIGIFIGSIVGGIIDIILCPANPTETRDKVHYVIFYICCVLCFCSLVSACVLGIKGADIRYERESKDYNNGICSSCGGHMIYLETSKACRRETEYFYQCDKCKRTIRTTSFY